MKLQTRLFLGYGAVFLLMILIATITYQGFAKLSDPVNSVAYTQRVIAQSFKVQKLLVDMETGQRGYLITGTEEFLEPYRQGSVDYRQAVFELEQLVKDNPTQLRKIEKIDRLVKKWQTESAQPLVDVRREIVEGSIDADYLQQILAKGVGKNIHDEIRKLLDSMNSRFDIDGNIRGVALVEAIAKAMVDQETGQRGYLITGREEFLEPFHQGQTNLQQKIGLLRVLVSNAHDRIGTTSDLNELEKLANRWRQQAAEPEIAMRRNLAKGKGSLKSIEKAMAEGTGKTIFDAMRDITSRMQEMFIKSENDKALTLLLSVIKAMIDQETGQRGYLITGKESFLTPYSDGQEAFSRSIKALRLINANAYDVLRIHQIINQVEILAQDWLKKAAEPEIAARRQMNAASSTHKDIRLLVEAGNGKLIMDTLRDLLGDFIAVEEGLLLERGNNSAAVIGNSTLVLTLGTFVAIVLGMGVMLFNTRSILQEVGGEPGDIASMTQRIAEGDLELDIAQNRSGIAAAVGKMVVALRKSQNTAVEQDWLKSGLNELSERAKGDYDLLDFTEVILHFLAEYLQVQIGAVYVPEPHGDMLKLMGSYAFTRRKGLNDKIKMGEGLVGEAARTKKMISVAELPKDYTRISSAIGDVCPLNTVVVPLIVSGELTGVIELGSIKEIADIKLEFLTNAAKIIAVSIKSVQARFDLEAANTDLQEQTLRLTSSEEELRSQSDSLKASNEELQEQTLRLTSSEEELKSQSDALRISNEALEQKQTALLSQSSYLELSKKDLEIKAQELALASKYKSEFLANMSHELRTPLNSVLILSKLLVDNKEGNLTDEQVESASVIYSGGSELLHLINDVLDLAKVEAGEVRLNIDEVNFSEIEQMLVRQFKHLALEKPFEFTVDFDAGLPVSFVSDKQRVLQVIKNLISNAFKFTHKGEVILRVFLPDEDVQFSRDQLSVNNCIGFSISDTGIGIAQDKLQTIFEAFKQADGSTDRDYGGTGLGLSISRDLCDLLQGEIQLESQPGKGSTFIVYLPLQYDEESSMQQPRAVAAPTLTNLAPDQHESASTAVDSPAAEFVRVELPLSHEIPFLIPDDRDVISVDSRSVLIVEDDRSFASVLKGIAHQKDYSCLVAGNGQCALQLAKKYSPSAILLDVNLPDIDGLKLLSLFKQDLNTRHIPVHVITGRECMGESLAQGAVGFLHKPTDSEEIDNVFAIFDHYLSDRNKRILLIEDNQQYRSSLIKLLENKDVSIIEAATGKEGIKQLKNNDFDCVILDMQLPDVSGEEILRQLSQFKTKPLPPIIINTGKELSEDLFKELNKYTEEIIIKGTESAERLLDEVTLFLHQAESNLPDNQRKTLQMLHDDSVALQGYTVLMVDDDLRNCFALTNLLEGHGLEVIVAENGQVALDRLAQHPQIDLVLMDIMMPVMDGYEAIEKIRAQKQYLNLPIIALTAKAMAEDKHRCLEIGASDYMNKPIDNDRLLSLIKVTLH